MKQLATFIAFYYYFVLFPIPTLNCFLEIKLRDDILMSTKISVLTFDDSRSELRLKGLLHVVDDDASCHKIPFIYGNLQLTLKMTV